MGKKSQKIWKKGVKSVIGIFFSFLRVIDMKILCFEERSLFCCLSFVRNILPGNLHVFSFEG